MINSVQVRSGATVCLTITTTTTTTSPNSLNLLGALTQDFQACNPCLTSTGIEDGVLVMPHSPLGDYDPESIDPEVEEVPAKNALVSVSVKIIGLDQKRSEHKTFMLHDTYVKKIDNIRSLFKKFLTNLEVNLSIKT